MLEDLARRSVVAVGTLALLAGGPGKGVAQSPRPPESHLTVSAGLLTTGPLWTIARQAALVPPDSADTLTLGRRPQRPAVTAAVAFTRFGSRHIGWSVEARYVGLRGVSRCAPVVPYAPDTLELNRQACTALDGRKTGHGLAAMLGGLVLRTGGGSESHLSVRAVAGFAWLGRSLVRMETDVAAGDPADSTVPVPRPRVVLLEEKDPVTVTWIVAVSAGAHIAMGQDLNASVEVADIVLGLPVPTGPATFPGGAAQLHPYVPVARKAFHFPTLSVGVDVVFGRERRRRY